MNGDATSMFSARLLTWFDSSGRHDLPWQHPRSPYRVWLSEIMLQQTQVQTVIPYFERFVRALPDVAALANAELDHVVALWAGLGYYARARNLHKAAQLCMQRHDGELPQNFEALSALPGIGRSTAGAILAQAHGLRYAILDGNVKRTLCRYHGVDGWPGSSAVEKTLWSLAEEHLPTQRLADYSQAIMDFGATLCTRGDPSCVLCPLQDSCVALREGRVETLPESKPGKPLPERRTMMLVLVDADRRVLLARRPATGVWSGMWSLPEVADHDEAREFVGRHARSDFEANKPLPLIEHTFSHYRLHIAPLLWSGATASDRISDGDLYRWQELATLAEVGLPAPVKKLLAEVQAG
ncbi:MAG TPA: A/G-specific adenine glycosylase [Arenimonas sp.]|uniref:A/G-specific adenine glycosylase n=1 Tax=Arenimonas sp. TaxID=1872635 RepID=UPI002C9A34C4|nr:A/G-specific adenine glycosylase [Arenimonas sp.]HMB56438.1 A/G-specific adenine glycosylase [Arenimonas sp.]